MPAYMFVVVIILSVVLLIALGGAAYACTGVYVGRQCTEDGSAIIARCNDYHPLAKFPHLRITPAVRNSPGRTVNGINGFKWELPADTYKYISVPYPEVSDDGTFASVASNEHGVSMTATITGYNCEAVKKGDPNVPDGVAEEVIPDILAACCKTSREAAELLARVVDEKGSAEQNIVMIADQKETWYMEIYSGHQYCAVKLPEDKAAAFGNEFMLETVDPDSDDVICSKELFSLPEKAGFAEYDPDGRMNLFHTYSGRDRLAEFSNLRTWMTHKLLAPSTVSDKYQKIKYPFLFTPDKKVGLSDIFALYRNRYEGTEFSPDETGRGDVYIIGTEAQQEVHVVQVFPDLPPEMNSVIWLTLSESLHAPFIPISNLITDASPYYTASTDKYALNDNMAFSIYKRLNTLCARTRKATSAGVREYWELIEKKLISDMPAVLAKTADEYRKDPEAARKYINAWCSSVQEAAVYDAKRLFDDVLWYLILNTETKEYDTNFETLQFAPEKHKFLPFEATVDAAAAAEALGWRAEPGADKGTLVLRNGAKTITLTASNGHRKDNGSVKVSGQDKPEAYAVTEKDGRIYIPLSALRLLQQT